MLGTEWLMRPWGRCTSPPHRLTYINAPCPSLPQSAAMVDVVKINRAPVLILWAAVVAERLGSEWDEALTLGRAVAGLNAYSKGVLLGPYEPTPEAERVRRRVAHHGATMQVDLLLRAVSAVQTPDGLRALSKDRPISPASVELYLTSKIGERLADARAAMTRLARSMPLDMTNYEPIQEVWCR
jgi:hypothetical protein